MTNRIPGKDVVRGFGMSTHPGEDRSQFKDQLSETSVAFCLCHLERDVKASVCLRTRSDGLCLPVCGGSF